MIKLYNTEYSGIFSVIRAEIADRLLKTIPIHTGEWQSIDTTKSRAHETYELLDTVIRIGHVPLSSEVWARHTMADLPWAEDHFAERVSGMPLNPPPSHVHWPYARRDNADHISQGQFDHTYPERFWPKWAGEEYEEMVSSNSVAWEPHRGTRFDYGDLDDVIQLLGNRPLTRQAFLPVWFPEDTGGSQRTSARHPCTLGYHFMIRDEKLSCRYYMRSCDIYRHFHNDIYMAGRLMQWTRRQLFMGFGKSMPELGELIVYISSLHGFVGDVEHIQAMVSG